MGELNSYKDLWEGSMLLIDKPLDWTSFDVVNKVRYALKIKKKMKVGHAGTLDPKATGLLILCTGKFTKKINELQGLDKVYEGIIHLGATTESYDSECEINQTFDISSITHQMIHECAKTFIGKQTQFPPAHSAVKINGERAYKLARAGREVKMKSREIEIFNFEITKVDGSDLHFTVHVSKGTYIRSLANDFGKKLNNGAYLKSLTRTKVDDFDLKDAWKLDHLIEYIQQSKVKYLADIES